MEQNESTSRVMSVKEWLINLVIMCIPVVNIIFLFIWGFGQSDINETKKNWAKASLILMAIGIGLTILFYVIVAILGIAILSSSGHI
ncbi:hypothetical protein JGH11_08595 [Dysgonomonas sp. Marseille-P4677]|uniref:hypothetical protein n=1 Tax=Dysgonomonas sp. Marseille-P4677 TaxID=2364790 RepID=UPI00191202D7|nr:hypothetical protein [Dysgonomonas sp. Marseille-P4677]MBK5720927.1 hypothetical protein [Dysgonomonas sp. Marseille-P4677]